MRHRNAIPRNDREAHARERALAVLALIRREKIALRSAAKAEHVDPRTVRRYAGSALRQDWTGKRYRATAYDRLPRSFNFLTTDGEIPIVVRDSRTASLIAEHMNAVQTHSRGRGRSALDRFKGRSFRAGGVTYTFVTDTEVLDRLADVGDLAIDGLYRAVAGSGV